MNNVNEDKSLNIVMTEPQIWGRRVMFAVLSLVVAIPLVNMRRLMTEGLPIGLASVYGLAGWVLLVSTNIKAFQLYQQQVRATSM